MKTDKEKLQELKGEFLTYFNPDSEYVVGYLDCLAEVCKTLNIPATRMENDVIIGCEPMKHAYTEFTCDNCRMSEHFHHPHLKEVAKNMGWITVQQAIEQLQKIENKSLPIYLETECFDKFYLATSIVERKDFVEVCTCFEERK